METVFGRRLWLPEMPVRNRGRRQGAERAAINAPMQGTAADLIKLAMVAVQDWIGARGLATLLVMQVHDELVLEVPHAELALVREQLPALMCERGAVAVPLLVEVGCGQIGSARTEPQARRRGNCAALKPLDRPPRPVCLVYPAGGVPG